MKRIFSILMVLTLLLTLTVFATDSELTAASAAEPVDVLESGAEARAADTVDEQQPESADSEAGVDEGVPEATDSAKNVETEELPDYTKSGIITFTVKDAKGTAVSGGTMAAYFVAEAKNINGKNTYIYTQEFAEAGQAEITDSSTLSIELAKALGDYVEDKDITPAKVEESGENGQYIFQPLKLGVYLILQSEVPPDLPAVNPFLAVVPVLNKTSGKLEYEIDVSEMVVIPEIEPDPTPSANPEPTLSPEPTPTGEPTPSPSISPSPSPTVSPSPSPTVSPSPSPTISPSPSPTVSPKPSTSPKPSSKVSPKPTTTPGSKSNLPKTGQVWWPVPLLALAGLALFAIGWMLRRRGQAR